MVTLAFAQMVYYVFHDTKLGGGTDGIYLNLKPASLAGSTLSTSTNRSRFYYFVLALLLAASTRSSRCCVRSRFGRALAGIRVNEQRMRAAGFSHLSATSSPRSCSPARWRAGRLPVRCKDGFVNPELLRGTNRAPC